MALFGVNVSVHFNRNLENTVENKLQSWTFVPLESGSFTTTVENVGMEPVNALRPRMTIKISQFSDSIVSNSKEGKTKNVIT